MATLTITEAQILHDGCTLHLKASVTEPANHNSYVRWYEPWIAGKTKSLSTGAVLAFESASSSVESGNLVWTIFYRIKEASRILFGAAGITFTCQAGLLIDNDGNQLGAASAIAVDNYSYSDADGDLSESVVPTGGAVGVYVRNQNGDDSRSIATAASITTPFKTLRGALLALFADPTHKDDGSQIWVVQDTDEAWSGTANYPRFLCQGPSVARPFVIKPVNTDGSRATERAQFRVTNGFGIVREGGGSNPSTLSNIVVAGLNFVNQDKTVTVEAPAAMVIHNMTHNLALMDCRAEGFGSGVDYGTRGRFFSVINCILIDGANPGELHSHGIFSNQCQGPYLVYRTNLDRNGYYNEARTSADPFSRNFYASNHGDGGDTLFDAAPCCYVGGWNTRSGAQGVQLRNGGAIFGTMHDMNPAGSYVSGYGGRIAFNGFCRTSDQLDRTPGTFLDTCSGPYINSGDERTQGSHVELNVVAKAIATHAIFNQRGVGFGGDGTGIEHGVNNNIVVGCGAGFSFGKVVDQVYLDGYQPKRLTFKNNIIDPRGSLRNVNFELKMLAAAGHAWLEDDTNGFYGDDNSRFGFVENINTFYSFTGYQTALGGNFATSSRSPNPTYPNEDLHWVDWYVSKGGSSGEAGLYDAIRNRPYRTRYAWDNWEEAIVWLQRQYRPTNKKPRSNAPLDVEGLPIGVPEWTRLTISHPITTGTRNKMPSSSVFAHKSGTGFIAHVYLEALGSPVIGDTISTTGLKIVMMKPGAASPTVFSGSNLETITTIGTYQAPSSGKVRFKEIDSTNMPGWYEIHLAAAQVPSVGAGATVMRVLVVDSPNMAGVPSVNEVHFSSLDHQGAAGANAQLMFDGTGYAGGTTPLKAKVVSFDDPLVNFNTGFPQVDLASINGTVTEEVAVDGVMSVNVVKVDGLANANTTSGRMDVNVTKVANVTAVALVDVYDAVVDYAETASNGEFTVRWRKNGVPVAVTGTPQIALKSRVDDSNIVAATNMTQVGSSGTWKYTRTSAKLTGGVPVKVILTATIDSATRTHEVPISRDAV